MKTSENFERPRHPIQVVANRTGLTSDVLRAWERRYEAVVPGRTDTGRRLYSDADIERLIMLKRAMAAGRSIGQVASLSAEELTAVIKEDESRTPPTPKPLESTGDRAQDAVAEVMDAVVNLDSAAVRSVLNAASRDLSETALIETVLAPLLQLVGDRWRSGDLGIANEHLATATVRWYIGELTRRVAPHGAKTIVIATPSGQRHEMGAMLAAATAIAQRWRVVYLGPDLPAEEIAAAVSKSSAQCVGLSIVYPTDDTLIAGELTTLRRLLPGNVSIMVGGRAAQSYAQALADVGAMVIHDLAILRQALDEAEIAA